MTCCKSSPPKSATHAGVALGGLAALLLSIWYIRCCRPFESVADATLFVILVTASVIILLDILWQKVHLRPSTGLAFHISEPSLSRSGVKYVGLIGSLGFIGILYWLFPVYHGRVFDSYFTALKTLVLLIGFLAIPYIYFVDRHMTNPKDAYWHFGRVLTLQFDDVDRQAVYQHLLAWIIKGFFIPLMFSAMCNRLAGFSAIDFEAITSPVQWFDFIYTTLYFIDVSTVTVGYIFALRLIDSHSRSSESTMFGWTVTLICYEPFRHLLGVYLPYGSENKWESYLLGSPVLSYIWGGAILVLTLAYVWSGVSFGSRFSNLSNRGILTNGLFRLTKHPSYVSKNISWWLISVPFFYEGAAGEMTRHCLMLLGVNLIYIMRAYTEERHLSQDSAYVAYALWMEDHGIFRFVRDFPLLKYLCYSHRFPHFFPAKAFSGTGNSPKAIISSTTQTAT